MSTGMLLVRTLAEVVVVLTLVFGFLKENKMLKWERRAFRWMRALRKKIRAAREEELRKELMTARYADEYVADRSSRTAAKVQSRPEETKKQRRSAKGRVA